MKRRKAYGSIIVLLFLAGFLFLLQSCDLTSQEESFENPYTEKTEQTFDDISGAVFNNIAQNIEGKAYGTVTREDIMRYANEGYRQWAQSNGSEPNAFKIGVEASRRMQNIHLKSSSSSSQTATLTLDSLLTELNLTDKQKSYILELPKVVAETGNIAELERKLNAFDERVYEQLGKEDSKPVLKMSALTQASMDFITTDSKLLALLGELAEESDKQQSYFYRPSLGISSNNLFHLAQSDEGPPDASEYFDGYEVTQSMLNGALAGGAAGAEAGILTGFMGAGMGALFGAIAGSSANGNLTFRQQLAAYQEAVNNWCEQPTNAVHEDYNSLCN